MKLNRKMILIASLLLSVVMATTGTLAYLTDTATKTNTFTLGNVKIDLEEPSWNDDEEHVLYPGAEIAKDPYIKNIGRFPAYVWMTVEMPKAIFECIDIGALGSGWSNGGSEPVKNEDGDVTSYITTLKYAGAQLAAGESTPSAFNIVKLRDSVTNEAFMALPETFDIVVNAYAIEANAEFESFESAYAAYTNQLPTEVSTADELVTAMNKGGNVKLMADISDAEQATIPANVSVTLDLNGHNISIDHSANTTEATSLFNVKQGASLTINGEGKVHAIAAKTLTKVSSIINNEAGTVQVNGGTYSMTYGSYNDGYLIPTIIDTNSTLGAATTTISGGTFSHTRNMFRNFSNNSNSENPAKLVITGGSFSGIVTDEAAIWNQKPSNSVPNGAGLVQITGGTFEYVSVNDEFKTESYSGVTVANGLNIQITN